jgi:hypothetical protein
MVAAMRWRFKVRSSLDLFKNGGSRCSHRDVQQKIQGEGQVMTRKVIVV